MARINSSSNPCPPKKGSCACNPACCFPCFQCPQEFPLSMCNTTSHCFLHQTCRLIELISQSVSHCNVSQALPKYWQCHLRVIGLKMRRGNGQTRGGRMALATLPMKLVPPGASPPVESKAEIAQSGIMRHVSQHGSKMILYSDGAQGWKSVCTDKRIFNLEVVHGKWEFLRKVKTRKKASGVACAGTQCIDRFWQGLDDFIPANVVNKQQGKLNDRLLTYVYSYMWRYHLPADANFQMKLGQLAKKAKLK